MHDVPTHLEVKDKLVFGLTAGQTLFTAASVFVGYSVFHSLLRARVPLLVAALIAGIVALLLTSLALIRPEDRSLDQWSFVLVRYLIQPKVCLLAREEIVQVSDEEALLELQLQQALWGGYNAHGFTAGLGLNSGGSEVDEAELFGFGASSLSGQALFDPTGRFSSTSEREAEAADVMR